MKRNYLTACCFLLACLFLVSCNKEEYEIAPQEQAQQLEEDQVQLRAGGQPDLIISAYGSNIPTTTTLCGPTLPNVSCAGGTRFWTAIVAVQNIGTADLPAGGTLTVRWVDLNGTPPSNTQDQTISNPGIPVGTSIRVQRPYFMGPCDCVPPFTAFTHSFIAGVDPMNTIPELSEANNRSPQFDVCDGC